MKIDYAEQITTSDNFTLLRFLKNEGLPKDEKDIILIFKQLRKNNHNNDYTVVWNHICQYLPSFKKEFGKERYLTLHQIYDLSGDMEKAIKSSSMSKVDKEFLFFVYDIN